MSQPKIFSAILALTFIFAFATAHAQQVRRCGTDAMHQKALAADPSLRAREAQMETAYQQHLQSPQRPSAAVRRIPVVVHIITSTNAVQISDARVQSQIDVLNEDFRKMNADTTVIPGAFQGVAADSEIEFCLATIDPNGCPTSGIIRIVSPTLANHNSSQSAQLKGLSQWDPYNYLNMWVPEQMGGLLGYATFPTSLSGNPAEDGVVLNAQYFGRGNGTPNSVYNLGRTGTHEVGHWLGLFHTFQGGCAGTSANNCTNAGDRVCDTPPTSGSNFGCPATQNTCTESPTDLVDQTMNFMDYVDDRCMVMLTQGQKTRMDFFLNGIRSNIWSPSNLTMTGCDGTVSPGCLPIAVFTSDKNSGCPGLQVNFTDQSSGPATSWNWNFPGGMPATSTQQNPSVTYPTAGVYPVTLTVTNGVGADTLVQSTYISVANSALLPFSESFEAAAGFPVGWGANDADLQGTWEYTTAAASDGSASMVIRHFNQTSSGSNDELLSIPIDLSGISVAQMSFDYAYKRRNGFVADSLKILVSSDCGATWNLEWERGGFGLATVGGLAVASEFVPTSDQWGGDTISLAAYLGNPQVRVMFRFTGYGGQSLYVDRINMGKLVANDQPEGLAGTTLDVYPNPSLNAPMLEIGTTALEVFNLELLDITGKRIWQREVEANGNQTLRLQFPESIWKGLESGLYILKLENEQEKRWKKLIKM